jgi:hypothetical protein
MVAPFYQEDGGRGGGSCEGGSKASGEGCSWGIHGMDMSLSFAVQCFSGGILSDSPASKMGSKCKPVKIFLQESWEGGARWPTRRDSDPAPPGHPAPPLRPVGSRSSFALRILALPCERHVRGACRWGTKNPIHLAMDGAGFAIRKARACAAEAAWAAALVKALLPYARRACER